MEEYRTVLKNAEVEIIEKKSRFICSAARVGSEEEALAFIGAVSGKYRDASHNVYAYRVRKDIQIERASDDGEPQGTAGIPVLEVIKREGLQNVCLVVTRYFGGILLGAGGLIRAYSSSAREGILKAGICTMAMYFKLSFRVDYSSIGKILREMESMGNTITDTSYAEDVSITVKVRSDALQQTERMVIDILRKDPGISVIEKFYDVSME